MALDFPGSPATGTTYTGPGGVIWVYDGAKWVSGTLTTGIYAPITNDVGRNLIHNSMFNIAQRGTTTFSASASYTLDRWRIDFVLDAMSVQQIQYSDADRAAIGDEDANNCLAIIVTGNAGATAFSLLSQLIENVRRLAGKTVTVSFWAHVTSGTPKIGVSIRQAFGTGGSPSAVVDINATPVTVTTTKTRYSVTFAIPSVSGKTLGTNGDSFTRLGFFFSSGANTNVQAGGIGVQSATFVLWGVQLELGPTATPLEKLDPVTQLQQCQRFYQSFRWTVGGYAGATGTMGPCSGAIMFPPMRATPSTTQVISPSYVSASSLALNPLSPSSVAPNITITAIGGWLADATLTLSADL